MEIKYVYSNYTNDQAAKMLQTSLSFYLNKHSGKCMIDKMLSHNDTKAFKKE